MRIKDFIKSYSCTFLLMIIMSISLVSFLIPQGMYAQSVGSREKVNSTPCGECKFVKSCYFNYYYAENGTFKCYDIYSNCVCTGPVQFFHCSFPEEEKCTLLSSNSCSPCPICESCYPSKCVGCYQFDLSNYPSDCEYDTWNCYDCIYRVTPLGEY